MNQNSGVELDRCIGIISASKTVVQDLVKNLNTGSASDGKIFVKDISEAYDIGSKEVGDSALQ